ncbi:MAG: AAA family ATPase [Anaerolineae bacterium]
MLTKLRVKNYKSLEDVTVPLRPLTVFVGPNNAGKSNILDCLLFLRELLELGAPSVHSRGGFQYLVWGGDLKRQIEIELDAQILGVSGSECPITYRVEIAGGLTHYALVGETFLLRTDGEERKLLEFPAESGLALMWDESGKPIGGLGVGTQRLYLSHCRDSTRYPTLSAFAETVQNWAFHDFVPARMAQPGPAKKDLRLQKEGENVSSVLHTFQSEYTQSFIEVEELLKTGMPEIERLLAPLTEEGQTYLAIEERGIPWRIPSWAMSDGTLRFLGQLAALFSPDPPALACFEEPENCIHPGLLQLVVDVFKSASRKTQILVTTHSPDLLNFLDPEDLMIVEKKDGKTQCREAKDVAGVKEALKTLGLGELWYSGHLGGVP